MSRHQARQQVLSHLVFTVSDLQAAVAGNLGLCGDVVHILLRRENRVELIHLSVDFLPNISDRL